MRDKLEFTLNMAPTPEFPLNMDVQLACTLDTTSIIETGLVMNTALECEKDL